MWNDTPFTRLLGLRYPIVQGSFGAASHRLDSPRPSRTRAGWDRSARKRRPPARMSGIVSDIRQPTSAPFAVNLWVSTEDDAARTFSRADYEAALRPLVPLFEELRPRHQRTAGGMAVVRRSRGRACSRRGRRSSASSSASHRQPSSTPAALTSSRWVTTRRRKPAPSRRPGSTWSSPQVSKQAAIAPRSCVRRGRRCRHLRARAAGGRRGEDSGRGSGWIADARGVAAALTLGAHGAQIGTAFLACEESNAPSIHKEVLHGPLVGETALTTGFSGCLARGVRNGLVRCMRIQPLAASLSVAGAAGRRAARARGAQGRFDPISLWSGQAAPLVRHHRAGELFDDLVAGTRRSSRNAACADGAG